MSSNLRKRIIALVERVSHRIEKRDRLCGEPKDVGSRSAAELHIAVLNLQYGIITMTIHQLAPAIRFHIYRQTSRSGRAYLGIMPRLYQGKPRTRSFGVPHIFALLDTHPFTHPIITTDLSKLGKRRLYAKIRAKVWKVVDGLERDEERAWDMLSKAITPPTNATP